MENKTLKLSHDYKVNSWVVASDFHSFYMNESCYNILIKYALELPKPKRNLIILGDFLDIEYGMTKSDDYRKWIKRVDGVDEYFLPKWEEEKAWGNARLDELQKVFNQIVFVHGNHDGPRLQNIINSISNDLAHNFNYDAGLRLSERGIESVRYNDFIDIGKLSLTHGVWCGAITTCHKKHFLASGARSTMFGHVHSSDIVSHLARGKTKQTISLPCMCNLAPEYMKNKPSNWSNGFGHVLVKRDGHFNYYILNVFDNELVLQSGKILDGNENEEIRKIKEVSQPPPLPTGES